MNTVSKLAAFLAASYIILAGGFCILADMVGAQEDILPVNAPIVQEKAVKIMTAEEWSVIIMSDIWKQPELDKVKISHGSRLGAVKGDSPVGPYGWQAFVGQDAIGSGRGSRVAEAYGGL